MKNDNGKTTTTHKIGSTTYFVTASPSDKATETIKTKVEKLILKSISNMGNIPA